MSDFVLDSSAVLAVLFKEPGAETVRPLLRGGLISSVNAGEVLFRTFKNGDTLDRLVHVFRSLEMRVIDFDLEQAVVATTLKPYSRSANLSFADRACLSLGLLRNVPVITAEHEWTKVPLGVEVRLIRERSGLQ